MESEEVNYYDDDDTPSKVSLLEVEEIVNKYELWHIRVFEEYLRINVEDIKHWKEYLINKNEELEKTQQRS